MIHNLIKDMEDSTRTIAEIPINGAKSDFTKDNLTSINAIISPEYSFMLGGVLSKLKFTEPENTIR